MKILKITRIKNCFSNNYIKDIDCDTNISKEFITYLHQFGQLRYFNFQKPYFKLIIENFYFLEGMEDTKTLRITLTQEKSLAALKHLYLLLQKYNGKE